MSSLQKLVKKFGLVQDKRYKKGKVFRLKDGLPDRDVLEKIGYDLICVDSVSTVYKCWNDGSVVSSSMHKGDFVFDDKANSSYKYDMY
jgi:hypothetical protein